MLVLTRKVGQKLKLGKDIIVTIRKITNGQVRISIEAPREVKVLRGELVEPEARAA